MHNKKSKGKSYSWEQYQRKLQREERERQHQITEQNVIFREFELKKANK